MYTFEQLKEDVRKEAEALKIHATSEELANITLKRFVPIHYDGCIYGMATGDCHSKRAIELIELCTPRYFNRHLFDGVKYHGFSGIADNVNGEKVENFSKKRGNLIGIATHFSAIEAYILLPEANNASLISYLRGETETLEL